MKKLSFLAICAGLCATIFFAGSFANGGDSTSYNPTSITVKANNTGTPVGTIIAWPSKTDPKDADKWLECDGRAVDSAKYPKLYALMHNTPNYNGQFLRGGGSSLVGNSAEDTIKSHTSKTPSHSHTFTGRLENGTTSGTSSSDTVATFNFPESVVTATSYEVSYERISQLPGKTVIDPEEQLQSFYNSKIYYSCNQSNYSDGFNYCYKNIDFTFLQAKNSSINNECTKNGDELKCAGEWIEDVYRYGQNVYDDNHSYNSNFYVSIRPAYYKSGDVEKAYLESMIRRGKSTMIWLPSYSYMITEYNGDHAITTHCDSNGQCTAPSDRIQGAGEVSNSAIIIKKNTQIKGMSVRNELSGDLTTRASLSGQLNDINVIGTVTESGELETKYIGASETAPKHTYVRYLICAK